MTDPGQLEPDDLNTETEPPQQPVKSKESSAGGTAESKPSQAIAPIPLADDEGLEHEADVMGSRRVTGN